MAVKKLKQAIIPYSEFTISYKSKTKAAERKVVSTPEDCAKVCREMFDADTIEWVESFIVIALNRANAVLGFYKVSQGGVTGTVADPRVVIQFALLSNATGIVVCHNHPSNKLEPSRADTALTQKLDAAAKLFDIQLLDHMILGAQDGFFSFRENGFL